MLGVRGTKLPELHELMAKPCGSAEKGGLQKSGAGALASPVPTTYLPWRKCSLPKIPSSHLEHG